MSEITRKLASIRIIKDIEPIEGADKIELVHIDGWKCVSKKGEFKVGDKCIYFEIDSFLPIKEEFEFLRKSCYKNHKLLGEGFRIRTIRLKGQISQGLVIPLEKDYESFNEGDDLTEILGVRKFELIDTFDSSIRKGSFPYFCPKSDEERVQNLSDKVLKKIFESADPVVVTEKCEGSSITIFYNNSEYGVCSRNMLLNEDGDGTFVATAKKLELQQKLKNLGRNIAIQGELIGPGVQGNYYLLKEHEILVFNIFDIDNQVYLDWDEVVSICASFGILTVPVITTELVLGEDLPNVDAILKYAERTSLLIDKEAEGVVFKNKNNSISFKAINNNYLLNEK